MIAAAKWPLMLLGAIALVAVAVAAPFAAHALVRDDSAVVLVGLVMLVAIAIPWVLLRSRRDQAARWRP